MQNFNVGVFTDFPTSPAFISMLNRHIATSIRDGVEKCACIATSKSFGVADCGAGVEEWAMDVEDFPSDVEEISPRAAPYRLTVDG